MMADRLISEQAVMESLTNEYNQKRTGDGLKLAWIEKAVSATPTASDWDRYSTKLWKEAYERGKHDAQPERMKGNWVCIDGTNTECDKCGFVLEDWIQGAFYNFCPNCGADMRKEQNGNS